MNQFGPARLGAERLQYGHIRGELKGANQNACCPARRAVSMLLTTAAEQRRSLPTDPAFGRDIFSSLRPTPDLGHVPSARPSVCARRVFSTGFLDARGARGPMVFRHYSLFVPRCSEGGAVMPEDLSGRATAFPPLWRFVKRQTVDDAPDLAICEFDCRKGHHQQDEWETCGQRIRKGGRIISGCPAWEVGSMQARQNSTSQKTFRINPRRQRRGTCRRGGAPTERAWLRRHWAIRDARSSFE